MAKGCYNAAWRYRRRYYRAYYCGGCCTGFVKLAYVPEMIGSGRLAPVDYSAQMIKDMIISARKQALISGLERDLLNDARENGNFTIYGTSEDL